MANHNVVFVEEIKLPQSAPAGRSQPPLGWGLWHDGKVSG